MARGHRHPTGLTDIADIEPFPARLFRRKSAEFLYIINDFRMPPIPVPAQPHGLPCGSGLGQLHGTGDASAGVTAKRGRSMRRSGPFRTKQVFRQRGSLGHTGQK